MCSLFHRCFGSGFLWKATKKLLLWGGTTKILAWEEGKDWGDESHCSGTEFLVLT